MICSCSVSGLAHCSLILHNTELLISLSLKQSDLNQQYTMFYMINSISNWCSRLFALNYNLLVWIYQSKHHNLYREYFSKYLFFCDQQLLFEFRLMYCLKKREIKPTRLIYLISIIYDTKLQILRHFYHINGTVQIGNITIQFLIARNIFEISNYNFINRHLTIE